MHTTIVIGIALLVLGACAVVGRIVGGSDALPKAFLGFLPLWLVGAGINLYLGVKNAGYSFAEEAPIFLVVFAVALVLWWRLS